MAPVPVGVDAGARRTTPWTARARHPAGAAARAHRTARRPAARSMSDLAGSGASADETDDLLGNLVPALAQTFRIIALGYVSASYDWMDRQSTAGLGKFAATYSLPALCFLSIAQLDLGDANVRFLLAMLASKAAIASVVGLLTVYLTPEESATGTRSWSLGALFAMSATSSNDFALGIPVVRALFTGEAGRTVDGFAYLFLMAPITLLIVNPICFAILELAAVVARRRRAAAANPGQATDKIGCLFIVKQVLLPTIANPVVFSVGLGVLANVTGVGANLPASFSGGLDTVGASFASLALFFLGTSMAATPEPQAEGESTGDEPPLRNTDTSIQPTESAGKRSSLAVLQHTSPLALEPPASGELDDISAGRWVQAALLVCAKMILLPVLARFIVLELTGDDQLSRFAFVYGTFPASPQVLLFAKRYGASESDCSLIALTTLVGTFLSGPIVFASAEMITIDLRAGDADAAMKILLLGGAGWMGVFCRLYLGDACSFLDDSEKPRLAASSPGLERLLPRALSGDLSAALGDLFGRDVSNAAPGF